MRAVYERMLFSVYLSNMNIKMSCVFISSSPLFKTNKTTYSVVFCGKRGFYGVKYTYIAIVILKLVVLLA